MHPFDTSTEDTERDFSIGTLSGASRRRRSLKEVASRRPCTATEPEISPSPGSFGGGSDNARLRRQLDSGLSPRRRSRADTMEVERLDAGIASRNHPPRDRTPRAAAHRSLSPWRPGEQPCTEAAGDDPAVLCGNVRSVARSSYELLSRDRPGDSPPTRGEIDAMLRRLIDLQHQIDRFRVFHGARTVELEKWAGTLLRRVLTAYAFRTDESRPSRFGRC
jgi:hypothetical protein